MRNLFWLSEEQLARIEPFFPSGPWRAASG